MAICKRIGLCNPEEYSLQPDAITGPELSRHDEKRDSRRQPREDKKLAKMKRKLKTVWQHVLLVHPAKGGGIQRDEKRR